MNRGQVRFPGLLCRVLFVAFLTLVYTSRVAYASGATVEDYIYAVGKICDKMKDSTGCEPDNGDACAENFFKLLDIETIRDESKDPENYEFTEGIWGSHYTLRGTRGNVLLQCSSGILKFISCYTANGHRAY